MMVALRWPDFSREDERNLRFLGNSDPQSSTSAVRLRSVREKVKYAKRKDLSLCISIICNDVSVPASFSLLFLLVATILILQPRAPILVMPLFTTSKTGYCMFRIATSSRGLTLAILGLMAYLLTSSALNRAWVSVM
ncbi:hypothetical protein Tco_0688584 [Tanacetum coccineum]